MAASQFEPDPDEERDLWVEAVGNVTPLKKDHRIRVRSAPSLPKPAPTAAHRTPPARSRDTDPDETDGDAGYVSAGVDRR
ncbi:MAG: hypothetical protein ABMA15_28685, partial [Vicinamibacterales bacterium]